MDTDLRQLSVTPEPAHPRAASSSLREEMLQGDTPIASIEVSEEDEGQVSTPQSPDTVSSGSRTLNSCGPQASQIKLPTDPLRAALLSHELPPDAVIDLSQPATVLSTATDPSQPAAVLGRDVIIDYTRLLDLTMFDLFDESKVRGALAVQHTLHTALIAPEDDGGFHAQRVKMLEAAKTYFDGIFATSPDEQYMSLSDVCLKKEQADKEGISWLRFTLDPPPFIVPLASGTLYCPDVHCTGPCSYLRRKELKTLETVKSQSFRKLTNRAAPEFGCAIGTYKYDSVTSKRIVYLRVNRNGDLKFWTGRTTLGGTILSDLISPKLVAVSDITPAPKFPFLGSVRSELEDVFEMLTRKGSTPAATPTFEAFVELLSNSALKTLAHARANRTESLRSILSMDFEYSHITNGTLTIKLSLPRKLPCLVKASSGATYHLKLVPDGHHLCHIPQKTGFESPGGPHDRQSTGSTDIQAVSSQHNPDHEDLSDTCTVLDAPVPPGAKSASPDTVAVLQIPSGAQFTAGLTNRSPQSARDKGKRRAREESEEKHPAESTAVSAKKRRLDAATSTTTDAAIVEAEHNSDDGGKPHASDGSL